MAIGKQKRQIAKVKVLGIRTGEETKVLATYNSTIYCLAIQYTDGVRTLVECDYKTMLYNYLPYIDMD